MTSRSVATGAAIAMLAGLAQAAAAQAVPADSATTVMGSTAAPSGFSSEPIRLSPAEREAAIEAGAARRESELPINGLPSGVHGELGMEIGSGGTRALYGSAAVPLGENGSAAFSFMTGRTNLGRWGY